MVGSLLIIMRTLCVVRAMHPQAHMRPGGAFLIRVFLYPALCFLYVVTM